VQIEWVFNNRSVECWNMAWEFGYGIYSSRWLENALINVEVLSLFTPPHRLITINISTESHSTENTESPVILDNIFKEIQLEWGEKRK